MWGSENWGTMFWGGAPAVPLLGPIGIGLLISSFLLGGYLMQSRRRLGWFSTFGTLSLILIPVAAVATVTLPNVFLNGQVADADQVNANFDTLVTAVNYRTIARATGLGPVDDLDSGAIASRVLAVTKDRVDTALRIEYTDNLRAYSLGGLQGGCRWEVRVDGVSCPGGSLIYDFWTSSNTTQVLYAPLQNWPIHRLRIDPPPAPYTPVRLSFRRPSSVRSADAASGAVFRDGKPA